LCFLETSKIVSKNLKNLYEEGRMLKGNILFFFFFLFKKFVPALQQQQQPLTERSNAERLELNE
jgi:hypothetical protein